MAYFRSTRITYGVIVVLALALGHATFTGWALAVVVGGLLAVLGVFARRMAVSHVGADAARALLADDPDGAQEVLDRARAAKVPLGSAPLLVASLEAEIALLRGHVDVVQRIVDAALLRPRDRLDPVSDATARRELTAVGAIARATANDPDGALRAAEAVDADDGASLRALARATIARAIVFARAGRRDELGELLRERRTVLDLGASARERTLARAFARVARSPASSVYRRSATSAAGGDAGWIHAAAGDAADLLVKREESADPLAARTAKARKPPAGKTAPRSWQLVAVWVALVAACLVVFQLLPSDPGPVADVASGVSPVWGHLDLFGAAAVLVAGGLLVRRVRASMLSWERTPRLLTGYARGSEAQALDGLAALTHDTNGVLAANAWLTLATLATLRGDASAARAAAESGLARLATKEVRLATADLLYPELVAQWAFALAAEGDASGARGAIASMQPYCRAVRSRFRVELLARWREGDEVGASEWSQRGERDAAVGAEDEVLADAIRVAVHGDALSGSERARIIEEVSDPRWRRFLDGVAPGLAQRVLALGADEAGLAADAETAAEREAAAEEEIARVGFAAARA